MDFLELRELVLGLAGKVRVPSGPEVSEGGATRIPEQAQSQRNSEQEDDQIESAVGAPPNRRRGRQGRGESL
jgi:hypothetical protein